MKNTSYIPEGTIIKRKKMHVVDHPGVVVHESGRVMVIHNTPGRGVVMETVDEFSQGQPIKEAKEYNSSLSQWEIVRNARCALARGRQWGLFTNNCEHFISEVMGKRKESIQLQAAMFGFLSAIVILSRR